MHVVRYPSAAAFLDRTCRERPGNRVAPLFADDSENNLWIGVARQVAAADGEAFFASVEDGDEVVGVAVWTPPHRLLLSRQSTEAAAALAKHVHDSGLVPEGVLSVTAVADAFASAWKDRTGASSRVVFAQRLYEVREVVPPASVAGRLRGPSPDEVDELVRWTQGFSVDVGFGAMELEAARGHVASRVSGGTLFVWDDGGPVCMAAVARRTAKRVAVNYVYTAPELRNRGYAKACVAELSRRELASGLEACCLVADLANPASNRAYTAIGYRAVTDFAALDFER